MLPADNSSAANGHAYGLAADPSVVLNTLRTVKQCQQRRVQQYKAFSSSFRLCMENKDKAPYTWTQVALAWLQHVDDLAAETRSTSQLKNQAGLN